MVTKKTHQRKNTPIAQTKKKHVSRLLNLFRDKKGYDIPEWIYVLALALGLIAIMLVLWIAFKAKQNEEGVFELLLRAIRG